MVDGRATCQEVFDSLSCPPAVFPDTVVWSFSEPHGDFLADLSANDEMHGLADHFVWVASTGLARQGLKMTTRGMLSLMPFVNTGGARIRRFEYKICLKSGAGCWGPAPVSVFLLGNHDEYVDAENQPENAPQVAAEESGLLMPQPRNIVDLGDGQAGPFPASSFACFNESSRFPLICPADFQEGCPYGYNSDWECLPEPSACADDAAWKEKLASMWADYFGDATQVNVLFDGLLRQKPCIDCKEGIKV